LEACIRQTDEVSVVAQQERANAEAHGCSSVGSRRS
jgi:hypothetical protein